MTNFNNRMVLDRKSEPATAWSLVRPTSHRVDTHTSAICKTGIADTIVSKSNVLVYYYFFWKNNVLSHAMLPREGWNFDDLNQTAHPCLSTKNEDSSKTENRSWKEHNGKCLRRFLKRKMWLEKKHQEVLMTNYTLRFQISFENFTLWEIVARKPDFSAVSCTRDMHRLTLLIR